jgi:hydrogenase-4 component F
MFAYSSIEHMGIIAFAFGIGGPLGNLAGLLQMMMHSLTKSAIFFSVGQVVQAKGTQKIAEITGLTASQPLLGWTLVAGVAAIAGLPPFGIFTSEFLLITSTFAHAPLLAVLLGLGILLAFGALLLRMTSLCFGKPSPGSHKITASSVPIFLHLGIVLLLGLAFPTALYHWFAHVAAQLG